VGSVVFFLLAPGTVVGLIPWLISGWRLAEPWPSGLRVLGAALVIAGLVPLVHAFVQFARAGGTPAPVDGFHRYVRNPMYVAVAVMIPASTFGAEYDSYRAAVPAWIPRLRPWTPE
jgi:protein-S-isoprenylcysteine O-methyltransferase Ste14